MFSCIIKSKKPLSNDDSRVEYFDSFRLPTMEVYYAWVDKKIDIITLVALSRYTIKGVRETCKKYPSMRMSNYKFKKIYDIENEEEYMSCSATIFHPLAAKRKIDFFVNTMGQKAADNFYRKDKFVK